MLHLHKLCSLRTNYVKYKCSICTNYVKYKWFWHSDKQGSFPWFSARKMQLQCVSNGVTLTFTILCVHSSNERRRYNVTSSLIGWAHIQNDPWIKGLGFDSKRGFWLTLNNNNNNKHHLDGLVQDCSSSSALAMGILQSCTEPLIFNTFRPWQNWRRFADNIFKYIFLNENVQASPKISLRFVPKLCANNIPALVQVQMSPGWLQSIIWTNYVQFTDTYTRHSASMS